MTLKIKNELIDCDMMSDCHENVIRVCLIFFFFNIMPSLLKLNFYEEKKINANLLY